MFVCVRARTQSDVCALWRMHMFMCLRCMHVYCVWKWVSVCVSKIINRPQKRVIPLLCVRAGRRGPEEERKCWFSLTLVRGLLFFSLAFLLIRPTSSLDVRWLYLEIPPKCYLPTTCLASLENCVHTHANTRTQSSSTGHNHHPLTVPPADLWPTGSMRGGLFQRNS